MRTLRMSLAGTVILALLGGLSGVALAQNDEDAGPVTHFTGTQLDAVDDVTDEEWWVEDNDLLRSRGTRVTETIEWSDPRLPSELQGVMNFVQYPHTEVPRGTAVSGTTLLEGPEGYWTGEFTLFCDADSECNGMNTLTGHGAYEGLFAVMRAFDDIEGPEWGDWVYEGLIFEGEMPPMPDPIEASAE